MDAMDIAGFRKEYLKGGLRRADLADCPVEQFERWFKQAVEAGVDEPNAMVLATVDERQCPCQRTVLLKVFDKRGFVFFTNYESRKARHLAANPNAGLIFPWLSLERQVVVQGTVEKIGKAESLRYFLSRPRESQLGAWVSDQSKVISSRSVLEMKLAEMKRKFSSGDVPLPSFWGGYRVVPRTVEFWQGGAGRLHDRFLYSAGEEGWRVERLAP